MTGAQRSSTRDAPRGVFGGSEAATRPEAPVRSWRPATVPRSCRGMKRTGPSLPTSRRARLPPAPFAADLAPSNPNLSPPLRPVPILPAFHPTGGLSRGVVSRMGLRASRPGPCCARQARRGRLRRGRTGRLRPLRDFKDEAEPPETRARSRAARFRRCSTPSTLRHRPAAFGCASPGSAHPPDAQGPKTPQAQPGRGFRCARFPCHSGASRSEEPGNQNR